jgi:hypothetical protein
MRLGLHYSDVLEREATTTIVEHPKSVIINGWVRKPILISGFRCHIAKNYLYEVILT